MIQWVTENTKYTEDELLHVDFVFRKGTNFAKFEEFTTLAIVYEPCMLGACLWWYMRLHEFQV